MSSILIPSIYWAAMVALADLAIYPGVVMPAAPGCDVPAPADAYSPDHFVRVLTLFFVFLAAGLMVFALARLFRRAWIAALLMTGFSLTLTAISFDHDYPKCNSFSPRQSLMLGLGIYVFPTLVVYLVWLWRRRREG